MNRFIMTALLILLFSIAAFADTTIVDLNFSSDFQKLISQADTSEKPILIEFYTDW